MKHSLHRIPLLRRLWLAAMLLVLAAPSLGADETPMKLTGAGASFPAPLYLRWFRDYYLAHPGVLVDYQSIGSAGGVKDLIAGRVDFAGSDLPLTDEQAARVPGGVRQLPMAAGGIVLVYNLEGVQDLRLSRQALVGIFLGTVERWNDPVIAAANPGVSLPDVPIVVVARSDSSGTTYKFSRHLSAVSDTFTEQVGTSMLPNWPEPLKLRGGLVRGRGNDGVAANVRAIPGSIGYVQYAFGLLPGISMAVMENRAGNFVAPPAVGFGVALKSLIEDRALKDAADPRGEGSYPIVGVSWLLLRKDYQDPEKLSALKSVVEYAMGPGQDVAEQFGYIPFPPILIHSVLEQLK